MSKCKTVYIYIYGVKYFRTVTHVQPTLFSEKKQQVFLKLPTFLISTIRDIYRKLLTVNCKQRLLHGNEMVQYFQNYKC